MVTAMKLTLTLKMFVMFHCFRPQFTKFAQLNKIYPVVIVIARESHSLHSPEAHGVVSQAEVREEGVEINKPHVIA